ncbi:MAG: LamG domain-containing protein [Kiritimatiellaeota bacterium]|nr:LamG domain-containing protein [Kiritimatiellota bacterium]
MKCTIINFLLVLAAAGAESVPGGARSKPASAPQMILELTDGSRLVGAPALDHVELQSDTIKVDLKLDLVQAIEFDQEHQQAQVKLSNGDRLSGQLSPANVELKTAFGKVTVPLTLVRRIALRNGAGVVLDGLIMHYAFERLVDGEVPDETGNNPPAKLHGCKIAPAGQKGSGLLFGEEGGYAAFPDKNMPVGNAPRTMAIWIKTAQGAHPQTPFVYGQSTRDGELALLIYENDSAVTLAEHGNRYPEGRGHAAVTDGKWHHVVVVYDGKQALLGYVDGEQDSAAARTFTTALSGTAYLSQPGTDYCFTGALDEFMVFSKALTAEEVKSLYLMQK